MKALWLDQVSRLAVGEMTTLCDGDGDPLFTVRRHGPDSMAVLPHRADIAAIVDEVKRFY